MIMNEPTPSHSQWVERLYRKQASRLILYGRALGLSHCEAQDFIQEIFLALLKKNSPPDEPEFYCLRALRNRSSNYRRSLWRRLRRELESHRWFEPGDARAKEEKAAMKCLETLPEEQREVIVLKIWHSMTFAKIGTLLDISPNTAAGRYRYGLNKLKTCLNEQTHEYSFQAGDDSVVLDAAPSI
jgi:RNA polymerase sigma-70 factor (ECF subfamily)